MDHAVAFPDTFDADVSSPLVGEGQGGGDSRTQTVGFPPPLSPPNMGEEHPRAAQTDILSTKVHL